MLDPKGISSKTTRSEASFFAFDQARLSRRTSHLSHLSLRALMRWAEDRPSTLVVIRSMLSWSYLERRSGTSRCRSSPTSWRMTGT